MPLPPSELRYLSSDASIEGVVSNERWLSGLRDSFVDQAAFDVALSAGDVMVYRVASVESANGEGQLHYGLGLLMPGKIGKEYFHTRGHIHAFRPAAEVYICLQGQGLMLLEHESDGTYEVVEMTPDRVIYVPGYTTHQTINTGTEPLTYWGVLSSQAGHDYEFVKVNGFRHLIVEENGKPVVINREDFWK